MALKATIFKADLQIADMDRHYYQDHTLTIACHPSETEERMMVRLLAFALHADEFLGFGKGLSDEDEPDLWRKDLTGAIDLWIDVGLPDEKRVRKACNRADHVVILAYGGRAAELWWQQNRNTFERHAHLSVMYLPSEISAHLVDLCQRTMRLNCMVQDGQVWLGDDAQRLEVTPQFWKKTAASEA
ncbi:MAG: YaeQ family protein [Sterolibacterium sp.]|jgi:uncharacterized protein YaeQ|nr:YaeQ family protein [Sterolibacterium sp.]